MQICVCQQKEVAAVHLRPHPEQQTRGTNANPPDGCEVAVHDCCLHRCVGEQHLALAVCCPHANCAAAHALEPDAGAVLSDVDLNPAGLKPAADSHGAARTRLGKK
jgi:hypothetical protein